MAIKRQLGWRAELRDPTVEAGTHTHTRARTHPPTHTLSLSVSHKDLFILLLIYFSVCLSSGLFAVCVFQVNVYLSDDHSVVGIPLLRYL